MDTKPKKKSAMPKFKKLLIIILVVLVYFAFKSYQIRKQFESRREVMEEQRQVLIDSWKDQGLSEEEIQEKLKAQRSEMFSEEGGRPTGFGFMRMFRGGNRTGGGQGPGGGGGFHP